MVEKGEYNFGNYNAGLYNQGFDVDAFEFDFTFVYPIEVGFSTRVIEKEDGTEQRLRLMASGIHTFDGLEEAVDDLRKADLEDFVYAKSGNVETLSFTDPVTQKSYTVRLLDDETQFQHRRDSRWDFALTLMEVRS